MDKKVADFNNWLLGKLAKEEFHQLEKQALESNFLADALEGVELYHPDSKENIISRMDDLLLKKSRSTTRMSYLKYILYGAAACGLIGVVSLWMWEDDSIPKEIIALDIPSTELMEPISFEESATELTESVATSVLSENSPELSNAEVQTTNKKSRRASKVDSKSKSNRASNETVSLQEKNDIIIPSQQDSPMMAIAFNGDDEIQNDLVSMDEQSQSSTGIATEFRSEPLSYIRQNSLPPDSIASKRMDPKVKRNQEIEQDVVPAIGEEAFLDILKKNSFPEEWLFIRGLKKGDTIMAQFELNEENEPINLNTADFPDGYIERIMKESGKWIPSMSERIYAYPIVIH